MKEGKLIFLQKKFENRYKNIGSIYCPYLKKIVFFNSKGLEHIKFKSRGKARNKEDQHIRFKYLLLAPKVISLSHTLQGYRERNEMESIKRKKWTHEMKFVEYFEFIAIIDQIRLRIIVKQIAGGKPHFWSIIPFWKTDERGSRIFYAGNPKED